MFADVDNRQLLTADNPHLLMFSRTDPHNSRNRVLVIGNFSVEPQSLHVGVLKSYGFFQQDSMKNLCSGMRIVVDNDAVVIPGLSFYWLTD